MKETLLGTVLGDARLERHGRGVRLTLNHSVKQKEYIEWKRQELEAYFPSRLFLHAKGMYPFWRFVTKSDPRLEELWKRFYVDGRKRVPPNILELLSTPKALAVWFMDDGTLDKRQGSMLFETQSFSPADIQSLQNCLLLNFEIETTIHKSGVGRGSRLYVPVADARKLASIMNPYILPSMRYKLPMSL